MKLRDLALRVAKVAQDAGGHALEEQTNPHDLSSLTLHSDGPRLSSRVDDKLMRFLSYRVTQIDPFQGLWHQRKEDYNVGERLWCVGGIDGSINYERNMSEWTVTVSLFEFNEQHSAQPIIGVVHAPALGITYVAAHNEGAIRIRSTRLGEKREKITPSTTASLRGSVITYGMSYIPQESERALHIVSALAGKPADIKRVGPTSLDLCRVADGTYDAYFEPHLHKWDIPAVSAGTVVVWETQGQVHQWNGSSIHWRQENDVIASNGIVDSCLQPYLIQ